MKEKLEKVKEALEFVRHRDARWHDDEVVTPALAILDSLIAELDSPKLVEKIDSSLYSIFLQHYGNDRDVDEGLCGELAKAAIEAITV